MEREQTRNQDLELQVEVGEGQGGIAHGGTRLHCQARTGRRSTALPPFSVNAANGKTKHQSRLLAPRLSTFFLTRLPQRLTHVNPLQTHKANFTPRFGLAAKIYCPQSTYLEYQTTSASPARLPILRKPAGLPLSRRTAPSDRLQTQRPSRRHSNPKDEKSRLEADFT